jgi:hypothetical protein
MKQAIEVEDQDVRNSVLIFLHSTIERDEAQNGRLNLRFGCEAFKRVSTPLWD